MEQTSRSAASCADPAGPSLLKWLATVMKRPQLRLVVASAAVLTLSSSVLSQAAGPRRMISRMWDNRPRMLKPAESPLNPQNWFEDENEKPAAGDSSKTETRGETAAKAANTKKPESTAWQAPQPIDQLHSERPQLARDPFLNQPLPASAASDMIRTGLASRVMERNHIRPLRQPAASDSGTSAATAASVMAASASAAKTTSAPTASVPTAVEAAPAPTAPTLPSSVAQPPSTTVAATVREVAKPAVRQSPAASRSTTASAASARASASTKNEFADEFDAEFQKLVKSVMDRSATQPDQSPASASAVPAEPHTSAPLLPDATTGSRNAVVRIEEIQDRSELTAPDPRPVSPVTASNTPSSPSSAAVPAEVVEFRQFLAEREQRMAAGTVREDKPAGQKAVPLRTSAAVTTDLPAFEPAAKLSLLNETPATAGPTASSIGMASLEISTPALPRESDIPLPPLEAGSNSMQIIPGTRQSIPQEHHSGVMLESPQSSPARVLSNAPVHVTPDNTKFRKMSFEQPVGSEASPMNGEGNDVPEPLFIPGTGFAPEIAPPPPAEGAEAGQSRSTAPVKPIIDWSEDELAAEPAREEGGSWAVPALCGTGLIAAAALAVRRYRRRRSSLNP